MMNDNSKKSMGEGKCEFKIVELRNVPGSVNNPQVKVFLQNKTGPPAPVGETQVQNYELPVFNKKMIFNIPNEQCTIVSRLYDNNNLV